ncbi:MAG: GYF domain-containing protein [Pirellulaceae bacterium]
MTQWYVKILDETKGPFTSHELKTMAAEKSLLPEYWVRKGSDGKWVTADSIRGLSFNPNDSPSETASSSERATRFCPSCAEEILAAAKKCKHCGETVSGSVGSLSSSKGKYDKRVFEIAKNQKYVIYVILAQLVTMLVAGIVWPLAPFLFIATWVLQVLTVFKFFIVVYKKETGIILGILSLIPILGLIILLLVNNKATSILRDNGFKIGLLGVSDDAIEQFRQRKK